MCRVHRIHPRATIVLCGPHLQETSRRLESRVGRPSRPFANSQGHIQDNPGASNINAGG
jgi:hypothetical protein